MLSAPKNNLLPNVKDEGRTFAPRVRILNHLGEPLYKVSAARAKELLERGLVTVHGKGWKIKCLQSTPGDHRRKFSGLPRIWKIRAGDLLSSAPPNRDHARAALEKSALGRHTEQEWLSLVERCGNKCARCRVSAEDVPLTRDHVTSLSEGGTNFISNIQPLCFSCNSWKGVREIDFRPSIGVQPFAAA